MKPKLSLPFAAVLASLTLPVTFVTPAAAQFYAFTTLAGQPGLENVDGTNNAALFGNPYSVAIDQGGNFYVADRANHTIRKVSPSNGDWVVSTIAGQAGVGGWTDGQGSVARFRGPTGIGVDSSTNLYVIDSMNSRVRKLSPSGTNWVVSTLASRSTVPGSGYKDGSAFVAQFNYPSGIAVDASGTCYVADTFNHTIRQVDSYGYTTTIAGYASAPGGGVPGSADGTNTNARFRFPESIVVSATGELYVSDRGNHTIRKITKTAGNWVVTTLAGQVGISGALDGMNSGALFNSPAGLALTPSGDIIVADSFNHTLRKIVLSGTNAFVTSIAGTSGLPGAVDASAATSSFTYPQGVAADPSGSILIADTYNSSLRMLSGSGDFAVVSTIVGNPAARRQDGAGSQGRFWLPYGLVRAPDGTLYIADSLNHTIRSLQPSAGTWTVRTIAGFPGAFGSTDGTNSVARFSSPNGLTIDQNGDLFVADTYNGTIRRITQVGTDWVVTTIAGVPGTPPPGTDGTNSAAHFYLPVSIAADVSGNLFVADTMACAIRKISRLGSDWVVTTIAGSLGSAGALDGTNSSARFRDLNGIAVGGNGDVYVADAGNQSIRKIARVDTNWVVTTIAGALSTSGYGSADGTNRSARFNSPASLALDAVGNLFVADSANNTIRKIAPSGTNWITTTVAGLAGSAGFADGTGKAVRFAYCWGIDSDPSGNLFVADTYNDTIRFGQPTYTLRACASGSQAIISWPAAATNFQLETRSNLLPGPWTSIDSGIHQTSDFFIYTNDSSLPQGLFRLRSR